MATTNETLEQVFANMTLQQRICCQPGIFESEHLTQKRAVWLVDQVPRLQGAQVLPAVPNKSKEDLLSSLGLAGTMSNEHYHDTLTNLGSDAGLRHYEIKTIVVLCAFVKDKTWVLRGLQSLTPWTHTNRMADFVEKYMVQCILDSPVPAGFFEVVRVASTFPGHELHHWAATADVSRLTLEDMCKRPTFSQLWLDDEMQSLAETGFRKTWDLNEVSDDMYSTLADDQFSLVAPAYVEIRKSMPYTRMDVLDWLLSMVQMRIRPLLSEEGNGRPAVSFCISVINLGSCVNVFLAGTFKITGAGNGTRESRMVKEYTGRPISTASE